MKTKTSLLFILSLFALVSCGNTVSNSTAAETTQATTESVPETTEETTEETTSIVVTKSLVITSLPSLDLYVYDILDLSEMIISENTFENDVLVSSEVITDYSLIWDVDKTPVAENYRFVADGDYTINIEKEGTTGTNITFSVSPISAFIQSLKINSYPQLSYKIGDTFNLDGLSVSLSTKYKKEKNVRLSEIITDYNITIDNKSVENFVFEDMGSKNVVITYEGFEKTLETSFFVSACGESNLKSLDSYEDDSIQWDTDKTKMSVTITNENKPNAEGDKGYFTPDEVSNEYFMKQYNEENVYDWYHTPSVGKVPFLVVPVIVPGYEKQATNENWELIYKAFFGKSSDLHFESLHSYYYKSSFGKLDITGGVTGYFTPSTVSSAYSTASGFNDTGTLAQLACDWAAKTYGINLQDYDTNDDGCIDGMWMIYLHPTDGDTFWAYTSATQSRGTANAPKVNTYGWSSLDFLNDRFRGYGAFANAECDAHVLIHETGHMLGLADYYSYGDSSYAPMGNMDMMDHNINDHNSYSKMLYGWIKPYIVYGNATIELDSTQSENTVIVIPYDDYQYSLNEDGKVRFTPFDEYLCLDYFTPKNLNSQGYDCYGMYPLSTSGGRLLHIDSRLLNYSYQGELLSGYELLSGEYTSRKLMVISNTESGQRAESTYGLSGCNNFDELRWITADNVKATANNGINNKSLFKAENTFTFSQYASQFNKTTINGKTYYFNNQKTTSATIQFNSIA